MGISLLKQYCIACDECSEIETSSHGDNNCWYRKSVENWLRKSGWSIGKKVLCPNCRKKRIDELSSKQEGKE